VERKAAKMMI